MDIVYVVPGIMGSELFLRDERLWPPSLLHPNVQNPQALLDSSVRVGDLIRRAFIWTFYDELLKPLEDWGYWEGHGGARGLVVPWPYNWLRGIPETAVLLAQSIRERLLEHPGHDEVVLLAHSMGGLICTYALECLIEEDEAWRSRVRLFVTFGTPFLGAPESLLNAFGVEGVQGIKAADCPALMADPAFPSAYQLFPHLHTLSLWKSAAPLDPLPEYQNLDPYGVKLGAANVLAAKSLQRELQAARPNPGTRKFNFCGSTLKTVWAVRKATAGGSVEPEKSKAGDETVPSWSGRQNSSVQFAPLGQKHSSTFGAKDLLEKLHLLLTRTAPPPGSGGAGGSRRGSRPPRPPPEFQPRVSVSRNAISSQRTEVEVEISEPPRGGVLNLAWMPVRNVETPEDLELSVALMKDPGLEPVATVQLDEALDFPMLLNVRCPSGVGEFALAAWAGLEPVMLSELDTKRMDVVWYFADQTERGESTPQSGNISVEPEDGPLATEAKPAKQKQEEAPAHQLMHFQDPD